MAASDSTLIPYNARIDGLRAVAVLFVLVWHWLPRTSFANWLPNGQIGVDIFFVLSGYLITSILLKFRDGMDRGHSFRSALGHFYVRRVLRLFPLYYLVLCLVYLVPNVTGTAIRTAWPWYASFLQNIWMYRLGDWDGFLAPFWSLAVEEQYYLVWGATMLAAPRAWLVPLAFLAVAGAVAFRIVGVTVTPAGAMDPFMWNILAPSCADALALGSIVALLTSPKTHDVQRFETLVRHATIPALVIILMHKLAPDLWAVLGRLVVALVAVRLVLWAIGEQASVPSWPARVLEWKPVVEFGKRSYGLYVLHNLMPYGLRSVRSVLERRGVTLPAHLEHLFEPPWSAAVYFTVLVGVAFASWRWLESPINRLKRHFES